MVAVHYLFLGTFDQKSLKQAEEKVVEKAIVAKESSARSLFREPKMQSAIEAHDYPLFAEYNPGEPEVKEVKEALKPSYSYSLKNKGKEKARIAIVIDDVGMNRKQSRAVVDIESVPLTLAFLPYAPNLDALTKPAQEMGHELIIHMPMEPMDGKIDTGPIALKSNMNGDQLKDMLEQAFNSFDGYVGLNNHMGSRLTQDKAAMDILMDQLDKKGLFYLDSKTISTSLAARAAREQGIRFAERDVFLDHEDSLSFVRNALKRAENVALEKGYAIAIGHPKGNTISGLKEWIPTLEARGFEIVPVSELLMHPSRGDVKIAKADNKPKKRKKKILKKKPKLQDIEPAAGEDESAKALAVEDLLSAPIGVNEDATEGLYSLSE